jgi:hypothetical protein
MRDPLSVHQQGREVELTRTAQVNWSSCPSMSGIAFAAAAAALPLLARNDVESSSRKFSLLRLSIARTIVNKSFLYCIVRCVGTL